MTCLRTARYIALDSSTLGRIAQDFYHSSSENRKKARETLELFNHEGVIPLITSLHLHELIQHDNDHVVQDRIKFLESLPCVAWFDSISSPGFLGSIVDLHAAEVDVLVRKGVCTFPEMIELVRERLLRFGKGVDIIQKYEGNWNTLQTHLQARLIQNRKIAICQGVRVPCTT